MTSLEIRFKLRMFHFGHWELNVIRALAFPEAAHHTLAYLKVSFKGYAARPELSDGEAHTAAQLRALDSDLSSLPHLENVTFHVPHGASRSGGRTFWRTTFQAAFVGLHERGRLCVTSGALRLCEQELILTASAPTSRTLV